MKRLIIVAALWVTCASATINIEITQAQESAMPVAVLPFKNNGSLPDLATIIGRDLNNTGQFKSKGLPDLGVTLSADDLDDNYFRGESIDHVLRGEVIEKGRFCDVKIQLTDAFRAKGNQKGQLVLSQTFSDIHAQDMVALGHHIADIVFEKMTGIKGAFSTRIAYVIVDKDQRFPYRLEVADYNGDNPQVLMQSTEPLMSPTWSPDGKKLAVVSFETKRAVLVLLDLTSGSKTVLSHFPGINGAPAFSPDGRSLALVLSKEGTPSIYQLSLENGSLDRLTSGYAIDTEPQYSPNGKNIIFTSNRGGKPQIYQLTLSTGAITRLTFQGEYNARARYTPDGKSLIVLHRDDLGKYQIARFDLVTKNMVPLTFAAFDESPSVAPNGTMVLYGSFDGTRNILKVVSIDGRVQLKLPAGKGHVQEPAWSPYLNNA